MGPVILARAGLDFAVKVHGLRPLLHGHARTPRASCPTRGGRDGAAGILVGSVHIAERLFRAVDDPDSSATVRLGPPGVDTHLFAPIPLSERALALEALAARLRELDQSTTGSSWDRDPAAAADSVDWFAEGAGPRAIYVGKLIVSKGVDLLLRRGRSFMPSTRAPAC